MLRQRRHGQELQAGCSSATQVMLVAVVRRSAAQGRGASPRIF